MDQTIIIGYLAGIFILGLWAGKGVNSIAQFSVAGRSFGKWIIFATLSASFIGGGFSMGNAEKVFLFGIVNIFALWGFSLKEILVAQFIAPKMDRYPDAISVGDIMGHHYGKLGKVVTGVMSVIVCAGILGAQVRGIGYIFDVFMGITPVYGILIGCGIVIAYSTVGGMRAVVFTDIVQFVVLAIGIPLTLVLGIVKVGGWSAMTAAIPSGHLSFLGTGKTFWQFVALFLSFLLGETLVPPYVQRLFLSKNAEETRKGTLWSGLFSIPFFAITGLIGLVALTLKSDLNPNLALPFVVKEVLPIGLRGIVVAGVISIVMSSADSFLNAASVGFTHDVAKPLAGGSMSGRGEIRIARLVNVFVGVLAVIFALSFESVLSILLYSYNFWSPIVLVPLVMCILGVKLVRESFLAGAIAGSVGVLVWNIALGSPGGVDGLVIGIACSLAVSLMCMERWREFEV